MTPKDLNPADVNADDAGTFQSPFCAELRSKKFFMVGGVATEAAQYLDGSDNCWCFHTQLPVGPDGGKVYPNRCVPGRSCYKSAL
jgi:hypothetical protein